MGSRPSIAPRRECCRELQKENARLTRENERLRRQVEGLEQQVNKLQAALDATRRAGKRQAAPFSKGEPKAKPRRPGRKSGAQHGPSAHRPPPEQVDEVVAVPLPECCPRCEGHVEATRVATQFQADIPPVKPHVIRFDVEIGRCTQCGRRVQGRHERQTSDALGAAASQVGPHALALGAHLNKGLGLSFEKVVALYATIFGLLISRSGLCQGIARLGQAAEPTYQAMIEHLRGAPVVVPDETGWRVNGRLWWLWDFVTPDVTVYSIQPGRGFEQAAAILGEDYAGLLVCDGWAPYRKFLNAERQTCNAHLLRRCDELLETARAGAARVPLAVKRLLLKGLELRDRQERGELEGHGLLVAVGKLCADLDRLLAGNPTHEPNRRLLKHLRTEREALFTYLAVPGLPATNWPAEQAIRPAVVTRKSCGGNRTKKGAATQQVLASVLRTCWQQQRDPVQLLGNLLHSRVPIVAEGLLPTNKDPPRPFAPRARSSWSTSS